MRFVAIDTHMSFVTFLHRLVTYTFEDDFRAHFLNSWMLLLIIDLEWLHHQLYLIKERTRRFLLRLSMNLMRLRIKQLPSLLFSAYDCLIVAATTCKGKTSRNKLTQAKGLEMY